MQSKGISRVFSNTTVQKHQFFGALLLLSHFSRVRLCVTPQMAAHQPPRPWDSPGKNTGVGCHFLFQCMKVKSESEIAQSCPTLSDPWTAAHQAPLSMGFSRQEYWSGSPLIKGLHCVYTVLLYDLAQVIQSKLGMKLFCAQVLLK